MAEDFERDGYFAVLHRKNFFGRPGYNSAMGTTASWDYETTEVLHAVRPADGEPAARARFTCPTCRKELSLRFHSVASARTRRSALRWAALGGLVLLGLAVLFLVQFVNAADAGEIDESLVGVGAVAGVVLAAAGIGVASAFWQTADGYCGVAGTGSGYPLAKHVIQPVRPGPGT